MSNNDQYTGYLIQIAGLINNHHVFINLILLLEHVAMERDVVWDEVCIVLSNQEAV